MPINLFVKFFHYPSKVTDSTIVTLPYPYRVASLTKDLSSKENVSFFSFFVQIDYLRFSGVVLLAHLPLRTRHVLQLCWTELLLSPNILL